MSKAGGTTSLGDSGGSTASGGSTSKADTATSGDAGNGDATSTCGTPSTLQGAQWTKTNWLTDDSYFELYARQDLVLARTWDSLNGGRVHLTIDNGANWIQSSAAETDIDILSIVALDDNNLLAATWSNLYRSTSGGESWEVIAPSGIAAETAIRCLALVDVALFAGATGDIYKSSDNGNTWVEVKSGLPTNATVFSIAGNGNTILAGTDTGVFVAKNDGTSWAAANSGLTNTHIVQLVAVGSRLLAVTLKGVFVSEDSGTTWTPDKSAIKGVNSYLVLGDQLLAGTDADGAYFSSDGGSSWSPLGSGLPDGARIWSLAAGSSSLYVGTDSGIWRASCD